MPLRPPKVWHEMRCAIHGFIRYNNLERDLIDSAPVQRLKHIHQLAMTYQVYPGATHRRFEHSLGVMDLAGRAFDSVMRREKLPSGAASLPEAVDDDVRGYWRQVLRLAALLHDIGHLPFSHGAEEDLLPEGKKHEHLTLDILLHSEIREALEASTPPIRPNDVVKLAIKPKYQPEENRLTPWEAILNEIINGDAFGVDRIDYLLRDSHHAGVAYGRFDPLRLLDGLVITPRPADQEAETTPSGDQDAAPLDPAAAGTESLTLGIQEGAIQGAEALLLARYFMYSQVYFHHVRRAYDLHLKDFMLEWFADSKYPLEPEAHLRMTDNVLLVAIADAADDSQTPGHDAAHRIQARNHFRRAHSLELRDFSPDEGSPDAPVLLHRALADRFGPYDVRVDAIPRAPVDTEVVVLRDNGTPVSGRAFSDVLQHIPSPWFTFVFARQELVSDVQKYLDEQKIAILRQSPQT